MTVHLIPFPHPVVPNRGTAVPLGAQKSFRDADKLFYDQGRVPRIEKGWEALINEGMEIMGTYFYPRATWIGTLFKAKFRSTMMIQRQENDLFAKCCPLLFWTLSISHVSDCFDFFQHFKMAGFFSPVLNIDTYILFFIILIYCLADENFFLWHNLDT